MNGAVIQKFFAWFMLQKFLRNICSFQQIFYRKQLLADTVYKGEENLGKGEWDRLRSILQWLREMFSSTLESDHLTKGDRFIQVWLYVIKVYRKQIPFSLVSSS